MTTSTSLQRASATRDAGPHDLTGRQAFRAKQEAEQNALAVDRAILELRDPDTALVWTDIPGRSARYPIPREVYQALQKAARR
jgi:hypothetical protein